MAVATGAFKPPKPTPVHFTEAIDFLRNKVRLPTRAWTDLWQDQHSRAFVVAGAMKDALVADFHEAVTSAIADGTTLESFRKDFDQIVAKHGWSYNGSRNWRSRTIFEANMRSAYSAGRWAQAVRLHKDRPYLRYVHGHPLHPRKWHLAWHNTILLWNDPWWKTHFTPNGWGCQCTVQSVSLADIRRFGWKISKEAPPSEMVEHTLNTPDGPKKIMVPQGIDPGWAYNPGEGAFGHGANLTEIERHGTFVELEAPSSAKTTMPPLKVQTSDTALAPRVPVKDGVPDEEALRDTLRKALGGDEAVFTDPTGGHVQVTQALADHILQDVKRLDGREAYWPFIRELIEAPQEIWVGFAKDKVSGIVRLRRRYVKYVKLANGTVIGLVADEQGSYWQALTYFRGGGTAINRLRNGVLVYQAKSL